MATKPRANLTVSDAAERFERDPSRIRQICIEYEIGENVEGRIRLLTESDMQKIGKIIENDGRKKSA